MKTFKNRITIWLATFLVTTGIFNQSAKADEGMWLLMYLQKNYPEMQKLGLKLSPEDIYSVNNSSLKDAVVSLRFCTAEIVSPQGLMLTNHHCAYGAIQENSSENHDYLKDGFWAKSQAEELQAKGVTASILIRMDDVTQRIMAKLNDTMTVGQKAGAIQTEIRKIETEAKEGNDYRIEVSSMLGGNQYILFVYETFRDIRLVGAPPSAIGKFGGDADNWEWPRHTGDFSLLRIYMAPDGSSASYSEDNIPYQPRHFFPISIAGVEKGDYSMVMGFPGRTERYKPAEGISLDREQSNPARIKIREEMLRIMKTDMNASNAVRIQYAAKYSQVANYWKYFIGQNEGLDRLETVSKKKEEEKAFDKWANSNDSRKAEYGNVISEFGRLYEEYKKYNLFISYINEAPFTSDAFATSFSFRSLRDLMKAEPDNKDTIQQAANNIKNRMPDYFKDFNRATDEKIFAAGLRFCFEDLPIDQQPETLRLMGAKAKGNWGKLAAKIYAKSIFTDEARMNNFLSAPSLKVLQKDPIFKYMDDFLTKYFTEIAPSYRKIRGDINTNSQTYIKGLMEMNSSKLFYPDANSTIRLTYGSVQDYVPRDAVQYTHTTTIEGIMEKEDPNDNEFIVPAKLKDLYKKKDYGRYGKDGSLGVNFITNNDITGGNSGSPVLNADGHLIGIAFDGNWEAMTGDLVFDKEYKRCINVDIRYVLFIIDKYAGAQNIINELTIIE